MKNKSDILKSKSPAALAEEYIIKSIWNQTYPIGSYLPSERELAEIIGVTRTTLREVLQRMAREGWLNIKHGKSTQVNDIWETGGPNVAGKLMKLDTAFAPLIVSDILSLRTKMADFYIQRAIEIDPEGALTIFNKLPQLEETAQAYTEFDYHVFRSFTIVAKKPIYSLIFNSFKDLYNQIGHIYFNIPKGRQLALEFYTNLHQICQERQPNKVYDCIKEHREKSGVLWNEILGKIDLPKN